MPKPYVYTRKEKLIRVWYEYRAQILLNILAIIAFASIVYLVFAVADAIEQGRESKITRHIEKYSTCMKAEDDYDYCLQWTIDQSTGLLG